MTSINETFGSEILKLFNELETLEKEIRTLSPDSPEYKIKKARIEEINDIMESGW